MTFIPQEIVVGDRVRLAVPMATRNGRFTGGHEFEVIDVRLHGSERLYDLRDLDLNLLSDVSPVYLERVGDVRCK